MKLYIKKISSILLLTLFVVFNSCENEESLVITTPDAEFVLQEPAINSGYLNFGLPQNPALTATWIDDITTTSSYIVEMSLTESFTNVVQLGSTPANLATARLEIPISSFCFKIKSTRRRCPIKGFDSLNSFLISFSVSLIIIFFILGIITVII